MKKLMLTAVLLSSQVALLGMDEQKEPEIVTQHKIAIASNELCSFLKDFATWDQEDKDKIEVQGLSFMIPGNLKKHDAYDGSLGYWIDCRTQTHPQREAFINCLVALKKQNKSTE